MVGKHAKIDNVISLSWLPITGRFEYSIGVVDFKAINTNDMKLRMKKNQRFLKSNPTTLGKKIESNENIKTSQEDAKAVFNNLPKKHSRMQRTVNL